MIDDVQSSGRACQDGRVGGIVFVVETAAPATISAFELDTATLEEVVRMLTAESSWCASRGTWSGRLEALPSAQPAGTEGASKSDRRRWRAHRSILAL